MAAYIDHVGYEVADLDWYITFFREVFEMDVERERINPDNSREIWLTGGIQLRQIRGFAANGHHLALIVDDLEGAREKALARGCSEMPKHHWVQLPDGLQIEMFTALPGAIDAIRQLPRK